MKNATYGVILAVLLIILYRIAYLSTTTKKEGFTWTSQSENDFLSIQNTTNPNINFDTSIIQQQASQEEVDYFNQKGEWSWSKEVEDLYKKYSNNNVFVRSYPEDSLNEAKKIYNQQAILQILSQQSKEGIFLTRGVQVIDENEEVKEENSGMGAFGYTSGLITKSTLPNNKIIKCNPATLTPEEITYLGNDGILNHHTYMKTSSIQPSELEKKIPGFSFINETCNPCNALKTQPDYSCPFVLDVKNSKPENEVSSVWKYLWNLQN